MQRKRHYSEFLDLEAKYEKRPSLWVEPFGAWGEGDVELYEIPSKSEFNDNIVVFWQGRDKLVPGTPFSAAYRLSWCNEWPLQPPEQRALVRFSGRGLNHTQTQPIFVIDFKGESLAGDMAAEASASAGVVSNIALQPNAQLGGVRVSFEFDPGNAELSELRAVLRRGAQQISETWLYRWTKS